MEQVNLSEYVSDYVNTVEHPSGRPPTLDDIAEGYCEQTVSCDAPEEDFLTAVKETIPEIKYLWPAGKRRK